MSKSILSVVVLAIVASVANAHFMEPLVKTSLERDPAATRYDRAVSLQQIDMKNYDSHKESLDTSVAGGNKGYLAKVPAPNVKAEIEKVEEKAIAKLEAIEIAPEIQPKKLVEEVEELLLEGDPLDVEVLAKDVEKIDPVLAELPHSEVVKALDVVVDVAEDSKKEMQEEIAIAEMVAEPLPTFEPIVKAEIMEVEEKAIDQLKSITTLPTEIKPRVFVKEIEEFVLKGEPLDVETLAKDVEELDPALEKIPHSDVVEAVSMVVNVVDEGKKEIEEAKELAEGCDQQPRFNILMCKSHMCTDCVLEYCTETCQKIQKDFPTCRCADWPASRASFSTGRFAGKGRYGDAGDYAKPGSYRFL